MSDDDFLYVDHERVAAMVTAMNASADTLGTIRADDKAQALATAVAGTQVGAAAVSGASSAATAIEAMVQQVRTMAMKTASGSASIAATDQHNANQFPQGN
ncbi:hypothetical protein [Nocardia acidivorans]|uniref:hypothetical protein n=1 Tax=Nocardia acidivorans TaxID=404580 RepID=UPI00082CF474|nr:hypothetical protein [Nocardia acidivorans]